MISVGSIWKRTGRRWGSNWLNTRVIIILVSKDLIGYRFPGGQFNRHLCITTRKTDFEKNFTLEEEIQ